MGITIEYTPIEKITIHQIEKHHKEQFLRAIIHPNLDKIGWCDGILFMMQFINPIDADVTKDLLEKKILRIGNFDYCETKYEPIEIEQDTRHKIIVLDQSKNPLIKQIIEFVKKGEWEDV